ncbi:uncharacterized protein LOC123526207 [Mercenaria mercenaria]|uniref:uncharacterized protein LOC123526207 n=1 Tax=Mercenaria mercenaria TaxID=6596 RepID=UPI00234FA342|nr:uncharacterized protein LOC123526207 [Mercenaria mercenaria]
MAAFRTLVGDNVILCDPCENEGRYFHAEGFCTDCNDYLCSECLKVHRRPVLWRYHQILTKQEIPKTKSLEEVKDKCVEPCAQHRDKILEYFCPVHDELACSLCMFRKHRLCQDVSYIPDIAESVIENNELKDLKDNFSDFLNEIDTCRKLAERTLAEAEEIRKEAVRKLTNLKREICNVFDQVLEDIGFINQSDSNNIKASNSCFNRVSKRIKTHVSVLEKKEKENKWSQLFVAAKRFKLDLKEMQDEVEKSKENCCAQYFEVAVTEKDIVEMRKCLGKIWKLNVRKIFPSNGNQDRFLGENQTEMQYTESKKKLVLECLSKHTDRPPLHQNEEDSRLDVAIPMPEQLNASRIATDAEPENSTEIKGLWSPANPNGIQQYSREFLLELQTSFHALHKPAGVLDIPKIVFDKPLIDNDEGPVDTICTETSDVCDRMANFSWVGHNTKKKKRRKKRKPHSDGNDNQKNTNSIFEDKLVKDISDGDNVEIVTGVRSINTMTQSNNVLTDQDDKSDKKQADGSVVPQNRTGASMKTLRQTMHVYLAKGSADNHDVISWIDGNVEESVRRGNSFMKILMTNICIHSLEKDDEVECVFDVDKIRDRQDLLRKYLAHNPDLELQALYALQLFVGKRKCPPGNIREILDVLYEADIISEDGFFKWETSEEMKECKETILKQVIPFFAWLLTKGKW